MSSCNEMKMGVCEGVCVRERESVLEYVCVCVFACKCEVRSRSKQKPEEDKDQKKT